MKTLHEILQKYIELNISDTSISNQNYFNGVNITLKIHCPYNEDTINSELEIELLDYATLIPNS